MEGSRILDIVVNRRDQVANASEGSATDPFACDFAKPAFDLVEPRGTGRGEVHVINAKILQPQTTFPF